MQNRLLPVSILLVGLAMAWAILIGLSRIADVVQQKSFSSSSTSGPTVQNVTMLPNNRFVIANSDSVSIYRVAPNGKLSFEDRAERHYVERVGYVYGPTPTPTATP